jgi:hypothetical protein
LGAGVTAPVRKPYRGLASPPATKVDPLKVLVARAEARAMLWAAGEFDLHAAVDELWAAAVRDGLVDRLGPDEVQRILAEAFAPERDDLQWSQPETIEPEPDDNLEPADDDYAGLGNSFAKLCRTADEKQARKHVEVKKPRGVPIPTLQAAEFLIRQGDFDRFRRWLSCRGDAERAAIEKYLEDKNAATDA